MARIIALPPKLVCKKIFKNEVGKSVKNQYPREPNLGEVVLNMCLGTVEMLY